MTALLTTAIFAGTAATSVYVFATSAPRMREVYAAMFAPVVAPWRGVVGVLFVGGVR